MTDLTARYASESKIMIIIFRLNGDPVAMSRLNINKFHTNKVKDPRRLRFQGSEK